MKRDTKESLTEGAGGSAVAAIDEAQRAAEPAKTNPDKPTHRGSPRQTSKKRKTNRRGAKRNDAKEKPDRAERAFPLRTLKEALAIPSKIATINNGNPWRTEEVAAACGYKHVRSGNFFYLSNAARDYGLTIGTYSTEKIELSPLGRKILYPPDPKSELENKIEAFFQIDLFKKVFDYYGGSKKLPQQPFLGNVLLTEFKIEKDHQDEFIKLFKANCEFLGIEEGLGDKGKPDGRAHRKSLDVESRSDIRVVGQPRTEFDLMAFVIMPFSEKGAAPRPKGFFDEVLTKLITPAGNGAGFAVETADRKGSEVIQSTIINQLLEADLVIADLTDHNPNVLFELGIRIAKGLPVALIKAEGTGPIFDVDHLLRVLPYSPNMWPSTVASDLPKLKDHVTATWENKAKNRSYIQILTEEHPHAT
jgi:hypothetical protein